MKAWIASLPPRARVAAVIGAVLLYALVLWFLLVSPKRAEATTRADDVIAAELRLADARVSSSRPAQPTGARVSDVLRLAKAMPASADQPGLVLELELLARSTGVKLGSITPQEPIASAASPAAIPVVVTVEGSYRQITRFVSSARELVRVRGGEVRATGRLFAVQTVELTESSAKRFPFLAATITLNAFVYDGPIVPVTPPPSAEGDDGTSSTGTSAARATP